jgi:phosphoribosylglycinamide formyltransferase 1
MKRIAVFVSGGGTNLQALIDGIEKDVIKGGKIVVVFSNKKDAFGLERAKKHNIPTLYMKQADYINSEEYDKVLADKMNALSIDVICLAGYMRILTKVFLDNFHGVIMNVHPALLPAFGGPGMYGMHVHEAVLAQGAKVSGCTVHFVDYGTDTGPIILQKTVPVDVNDTPESLQKKILKFEHELYAEALGLYCLDKLKIKDGQVIIDK